MCALCPVQSRYELIAPSNHHVFATQNVHCKLYEHHLVGEVDGVDGVSKLLEHGDDLGVEHGGGHLGNLAHDEVVRGKVELREEHEEVAVMVQMIKNSERKKKGKKEYE